MRVTIFLKLLTILALVICDQYSKYYIQEILLIETHEVKILPFLNLIRAWNRGMSFGMLHDFHHINYIFIVITILLLVILSYFALNTIERLPSLGYILIIAGALGNLTDRFLHGAVFDFIDFHLLDFHFATFNLADSFIFCGVMLIIYFELTILRKK